MAHPFAKMFETALRKNSPVENAVLEEAENLKEKGYSVEEIYSVLTAFAKGRLDDREIEITEEAIEEFGRHRDIDDDSGIFERNGD